MTDDFSVRFVANHSNSELPGLSQKDVRLVALITRYHRRSEPKEYHEGYADLGVTFAIVWDKEQKTAGVYKPPKMPTSYIIDKDGVLRHIHAGYESGEADKIDAEVSALLGK